MSFDKLQEKIDAMRNPTVVGLDPALDHVPPEILDRHIAEKGETLEAAAAAVCEWGAGLIDALCDIVPAVKPQMAYYEALGPDGVWALKKTCEYAKARGMYVIFDGKRNDIGSTAQAYSAAYLGKVKVGGAWLRPFDADAVTVNAYLGSDGIKPFIEMAVKYDKALFALVKTSNPSAGELQDLPVGNGAGCGSKGIVPLHHEAQEPTPHFTAPSQGEAQERAPCFTAPSQGEAQERAPCFTAPSQGEAQEPPPCFTAPSFVYTVVGDLMEEISRDTIGKYGYTRVGAVVGATYPQEAEYLRARLKHTFFLVPGYGAQGGSAEAAARAFDKDGRGAVINSSRAIIAAWKKNGGDYATAARVEALRMRDELRRVI